MKPAKPKPKRIALARLRSFHYHASMALISALKQRRRLSANPDKHEQDIEMLNDRVELLQDSIKEAYRKIKRLKRKVGIKA